MRSPTHLNIQIPSQWNYQFEHHNLILANQSEPIEQEQLEALFEKFYRLDQACSTKSWCDQAQPTPKKLILAHQGTAQAASKK